MMKSFDLQMKKRAQAEAVRLQRDAEEKFREAMDEARIRAAQPQPTRAKRKNRLVWLVSAECILAAVLLFALLPARDVVQQPVGSGDAILQPAAQPQAASAPLVRFEGQSMDGEASLCATFRNDTQEIWLVECSAQLSGDAAAVSGLIWLEPGAECVEQYAWLDAGRDVEITASYRGLRVQAKVLHWMEGELLSPEEEGYPDQQSLMEDAFAAGALILSPGDWANGQAGAMRLPLPNRAQQALCGRTALAYYVDQGVLKEERALCSGVETLHLVSLEGEE